jgi:hypothetical protein
MRLTPREKQILLGAARDLATWRSRPAPTWTGDRHGDAVYRARVADAAAGVVEIDPGRWLGPQSAADAVSNSRVYKSLERKGLVVRVGAALEFGQRFRTSALRITEAGERLAAELLANESPSPAAVVTLATASIETPETASTLPQGAM